MVWRKDIQLDSAISPGSAKETFRGPLLQSCCSPRWAAAGSSGTKSRSCHRSFKIKHHLGTEVLLGGQFHAVPAWSSTRPIPFSTSTARLPPPGALQPLSTACTKESKDRKTKDADSSRPGNEWQNGAQLFPCMWAAFISAPKSGHMWMTQHSGRNHLVLLAHRDCFILQ